MTTPVLEKPIPPVPSAQTLDSRGSTISQPWQQWFINLRDKVNQINGVVVAISGSNTTLGAFNTLSPLTTTGDMLTYGSGNNTRLPIGSTGQILAVISGMPAWVNPSAGSTPLTTKGDLYGYNTAPARIPVGTDSYVLTADSTSVLGVSWRPAGTPTLPVTTKGDILGYDTAANRIPVGTNGYVLTADSTQALGVGWKPAPASSPLTTKGDLYGFDTGNARIPVGADGQALLADSTQALGVKWGAAGSSSPLTTKGDLYGFSTINARIPIGTDGQVLTADSTSVLGVSWKGGGGNYDSEVLADTPAGYWKLNETSGTTVIDSSGNARNGTYTGGFTLGKSLANLDGAVQLDGNSGYATIPYAAWMDFSTAWSVEIWLVPFIFGTVIASRGVSSSPLEYALALLSGSSLMTTSGFGVGKYTGSTWNTVTLTNNGSIFSVYHMVGTFDGTTMSLYVNGNLVGAATYSGFNTASYPFYIGKRWDNTVPGTTYFNGLLSSCALYATSLSSSRILAHYNAGK